MSIANKSVFPAWVELSPRESANEAMGYINDAMQFDHDGDLTYESAREINDILKDFADEQRRIGREEAAK